MKFLDLILETRKTELTLNILDKLISNTDSIYAIHFSNIEKVGINPKKSYKTTPFGFYAYPLKQSWEFYKKNLGRYPYASDRKYVILIKLSKNARILNLTDLAKLSDINIFKNYFNSENIRKIFNIDDKDILNYVDNILKKKIKLNDDLYFYVFNIFKKIFKEEKISIELNKFFRNILHYDVIIDEGMGRIHYHEPIQMVILDIRAIENYKIYDNPDYKYFN